MKDSQDKCAECRDQVMQKRLTRTQQYNTLQYKLQMITFIENVDSGSGVYYLGACVSMVSMMLWHRKRLLVDLPVVGFRSVPEKSNSSVQSRENDNSSVKSTKLHKSLTRKRKMMFYRALPKVMHVKLPYLSSQAVIRSVLEDLVHNGVVYAELELDVVDPSILSDDGTPIQIDQLRDYITSMAQVLCDFEDKEKRRVQQDRRSYYSEIDDPHDKYHNPDMILYKYHLALVPRLILNITNVKDSEKLIPFICDPFTNVTNSSIVGISFDSLKIYDDLHSSLSILKTAKEFGLRIQFNSIPEIASALKIIEIEPDRINIQTEADANDTFLDKCSHIPLSIPLEYMENVYRALCEQDRSFVLSAKYSSELPSVKILCYLENWKLNEFSLAKLLLGNFHNVLENSRRTRSEVVKAATIRSNQLMKWVSEIQTQAPLEPRWCNSCNIDME